MAQKSLAEDKRNFEVANKAVIAFNTLNIDTIKPNQRIGVGVVIKNYGKPNVLIRRTLTGGDSGYTQDLQRFPYEQQNLRLINFELTDKTFDIPIILPSIDAYEYESFLQGRFSIFVYGEVHYTDLNLNKDFVYQFCYRLLPNKRFLPTSYHNGIIEATKN